MADSNTEETSRARGWLVLKHHMLTHKVKLKGFIIKLNLNPRSEVLEVIVH